MDRILFLVILVLSTIATGCDSQELPPVKITNVQIRQEDGRYQVWFELSTAAFWEIEASDQTDDVAAFFTIAQNKPRDMEEGVINTGPLQLNLGEDYILRILAYTPDDLRAGRAALAYDYIDAP